MDERETAAPISFEDFLRVDVRVGRVLAAREHPTARHPAYVLEIDFGPRLGVRKSSAQLCENYAAGDLVGRQVVAVVNFPPKRVAGVRSEVLVLGATCADRGTVLLSTERDVAPGTAVR